MFDYKIKNKLMHHKTIHLIYLSFINLKLFKVPYMLSILFLLKMYQIHLWLL